MRIEAAAYRGKPVYFELIGPWTRPDRMPTVGERVFLVILTVLLLASVVAGAMLARRNLHLGRGDRQGASRLAVFVFAAWVVAVFFGAHHVLTSYELWLFFVALVMGAAWFCFTWLLYIALEPFVRRRWPATLISWSRLLAGGFRDPLVGRDVLAGCLLAAFSAALTRLGWFVPSWLGHAPPQPFSGPQWQFLGARAIISDISLRGPVLLVALAILFVLFLLRALLRKEWAAATAFVLLFTVLFSAGSQFDPVVLVTSLILWVLAVFLLIRFGLLAFAVQGVFDYLLENYPLTTQGSAWYAGISLAAILLMAALAFYGFYTCLGGRPAFGGPLLEE
jgi:serine/threonine-protein kinase